MLSLDLLDRRILRNNDPEEFTRLWLIPTATYGVGDIVTTVALLQFVPWVTEANVLLRSVVGAYGRAGLVGLKLAVFLLSIAVSVYGDRVDDRFVYYLPPVALSLFGAFATAFNVRLFLR
ncbi:hypothetical protein RYH80_15600 [Halobaculum sp. MBLA0147]|uniref:hypothetical protein n=1 Tax=Halobaculum sp. MBLA0147 TaxID=3079934 RepID=UPI00352402B4